MRLEIVCGVCKKPLGIFTFSTAPVSEQIVVSLCTDCQRRITDAAYEEGYQDGLNGGEWS